MPRFFMAGANAVGGTLILAGEDANHAKVLRLRVGDRIVICDGAQTDHHCTVQRITPEEVVAEVVESVPCRAEPNLHAVILAGLPKQGERSDFIVQKCTEGGASEIVFFLSHRCVSVPTDAAMERKLQRWQRIAEEAAKQSGRGRIPEVRALGSLAEALDRAVKTDLPLFFYETGERRELRRVLEGHAGPLRSAAILTGPEGGFEPWEAELARLAGLPLCSMGPRILRCETAPLAALTALMYATGNL
ncbi:MAG: 16S rRNA (uracil(1498)-N(3))-methyltransferase [Oscillospiraceae bacterium]|nr:16S rRNA (uracil(1498)-N(3))-methyltransferase [Oscillospiraceae bacterium]MBR7056855.1 16S rRNA (uracil(1498)-N(3))-methyltransferase [Oscillospiraceae bacterium]